MNVLPCRSAMIAIMNCHTRDHHFYVEAVDREVAAFAAVIRGAELAAPVPTCPEWTLQDLVEHIGGVHRWAAGMVLAVAQQRHGRPELDIGDHADWLDAGR